MLTIAPPLPPRAVDMRRTASCAQYIVPRTLTAKSRCSTSGSCSSSRAVTPVVPALLTSPPIGPQRRLGRLEYFADLARIGHVAADGDGAAAVLADRRRHALGRFGLACVIHRHRKATASEKPADGGADASAAARHDHCPEPAHRLSPA